MDAPEISILREEEEESPPPEPEALAFTKFRVLMGRPWVSAGGASGSGTGSQAGSLSAKHGGGSPQDSDEDEEEDQLIDDDELAIVTETGRGQAASPSGIAATDGSGSSPRKRGITRGRQRRGGPTGRRGRPGREPPDAAAMMSTFELTKADQAGMNTARIITSASMAGGSSQPQQNVNEVTDDSHWTTALPPKPPRKKPGPKKGSALGPRGPRKNISKTAQNTPGTSTPLLDEAMASDVTQFLIPASIPTTPKSDQPLLPPPNLPPIPPPDFSLDPNVPVPLYPLPSRSFPVQPPPKIPTGYAPSHPIDTKHFPTRKWAIMQREIRGIAGGRWFARTWVAPSTLPQNINAMGLGLNTGMSGQITRPPTPPMAIPSLPSLPLGMSQLDSLAQVAASSSRLPSVKSEVPVDYSLSATQFMPDAEPEYEREADFIQTARGSRSTGLVSRTSASPTPPATVPEHDQDIEMRAA